MTEMENVNMPDKDISGIKVLVVDDVSLSRIYIGKMLRGQNLNVITASNGQEALDLVDKEKPSMVLLDLMLSVIDGYEVIRRLRSDPVFSRIRIIVVSALSTNDCIVRALNMGADDYIVKPIATDKFLKSVLGQIEMIHAMEADAKG